jgi:hypothetical protein
MRPSPLFGCLALTFALAAAARGEQYEAVVQQETEARCLPSLNPVAYPTNRLHPGDRVKVLKEVDGGWLAVEPPSGSFSWINKQYLDASAVNQEPNAVVASTGAVKAPVLIGSEVVPDLPTREGTYLAGGAIVTRRGRDQVYDGKTWMPIEPPPGELRYVRAEAVRKPAPAADRSASAASPAAAPAVEDTEVLYHKARDAEATNLSEAVALYARAAAVERDEGRRKWFLERARVVQEWQHNTEPAMIQGPPQGQLASAGKPSEGRVTPAKNDPAAAPTARLAPPYGGGAAPAAPTPPDQPDPPNWYRSGVGKLRKSGGRDEQGGQLYALDDKRGLPMYYVSPGPGVDLQAYLGRSVELAGPAEFNARLRANYIIAMRVQPAQ